MVDDLEDLFGTPRISDENALSTEGVEELFEKTPDKTLEVDGVDSLFAPRQIDQDDLRLQPESIHDLLSALADDLKKLADDIHALLDE